MKKQKKLVWGVGINDANYIVKPTINGKRTYCGFYTTWMGMLERSYSEKLKEKRPTYRNVITCEEWHRFSNFRGWMEQQPWDGMQLDKDILVKGSNIYSPETCVFVPSYVNTILLVSASIRGNYPLGVNRRKNNTFYAQISLKCSRSKSLGYYSIPLEAHHAWQLAKADVIEEAVSWWASDPEVKHSFNTRAADALIQRAWQLRLDCANGVETISL